MAVDNRTGETGLAAVGNDMDPRTLPEPESLAEVNSQINLLTGALGKNNRNRAEKRRELQPVEDTYLAVYDSTLLASVQPEATLRKAEAAQAVRHYLLEDGTPLAERRSVLKLELRILEDLGHDIRSVLSGLQTTARNLQAELSAFGTAERMGAVR